MFFTIPFLFLGYFSQELTVTGTHGQLSLRNANLFGRKLSSDESIINHDTSEEVLYLDTNNKNHAKIQDDTIPEDESNSIPQVYLQGKHGCGISCPNDIKNMEFKIVF